MKLLELKTQVFKLAEVSTTKQLKAKYEEIKCLDMRYKLSWEKALKILQKQENEFEAWLRNPPDEYRELFSEVEAVSSRFDRKLVEAKRLGKEVVSTANNLEELAEECRDEAVHLRDEVTATNFISNQAQLN